LPLDSNALAAAVQTLTEATPAAPAAPPPGVTVRPVKVAGAPEPVKITVGAPVEPVAEPKPEVIPERDPLDTDVNKKFKALSKQRQKLRAREEALRTYEAKVKDYDELGRLRDSDPLAFLEKVGLDVRKVNEAAIKRPIDPRTAELEKRQAQLEAQLKAQIDEAKTAKSEALSAQLRSEVQGYVEDNRAALKYVSAYKAQGEVFQTALDFQKTYGRLPSAEDVVALAKSVDQALRTKHEAAQKELGVAVAPPVAKSATVSQAPGPRNLSSLQAAPEPAPLTERSRADSIRDMVARYRAMSEG